MAIAPLFMHELASSSIPTYCSPDSSHHFSYLPEYLPLCECHLSNAHHESSTERCAPRREKERCAACALRPFRFDDQLGVCRVLPLEISRHFQQDHGDLEHLAVCPVRHGEHEIAVNTRAGVRCDRAHSGWSFALRTSIRASSDVSRQWQNKFALSGMCGITICNTRQWP